MTRTRTPADPAPSLGDVDTFVGIDPGLTGAIAVIHGEDRSVPLPWIRATPTAEGPRGRRDFAYRRMAAILAEVPDAFVAIEWVDAAPMCGRRQGTSSMFNFGCGYGVWLGILAAQGKSYIEVRPRVWKARLGLRVFGTGKDASVRYAKTIDPMVNLRPTSRSRVDSHGFADAYCLALYARSEWRTMRAVLASSGRFSTTAGRT